MHPHAPTSLWSSGTLAVIVTKSRFIIQGLWGSCTEENFAAPRIGLRQGLRRTATVRTVLRSVPLGRYPGRVDLLAPLIPIGKEFSPMDSIDTERSQYYSSTSQPPVFTFFSSHPPGLPFVPFPCFVIFSSRVLLGRILPVLFLCPFPCFDTPSQTHRIAKRLNHHDHYHPHRRQR